MDVLALLGDAFVRNRYLALLLLTLPVRGLLEKHGLKEHAQAWIARLRGATSGRLLIAYLAVRQIAAAIGLTSLGGHPQTVRPLLVPLAEGAAEARHGALSPAQRQRLRALCAATDNVGLFFGEDIFFAIGSIVLIQATLATYGILLAPLALPAFVAVMGLTIVLLRARVPGVVGVVILLVAAALPYTVYTMRVTYAAHDLAFEEEARTLGASRLQVLWRVHLPLVAPGLARAAFLSFLVGWSDYVLTVLVGVAGVALAIVIGIRLVGVGRFGAVVRIIGNAVPI